MGSRSKHSGSREYGAPTGTPKPGGTSRKRPKPGDKDPNWPKPKKGPKPERIKPKGPPGGPGTPGAKGTYPKKDKPKGSTFRDYRGIEGVLEDAQRKPKKK